MSRKRAAILLVCAAAVFVAWLSPSGLVPVSDQPFDQEPERGGDPLPSR